MMKKHIILLLCALTTVSAFGRLRTNDECVAVMKHALGRQASETMKKRLATERPKKLMTDTQLSVWGYENGGFAVVAHDSEIPALLGYSDEPLIMDRLTPSFKDFIATLNGYVGYCLENGQEFKIVGARQNTSVGPLLETDWGQFEPYYNLCPDSYEGWHCATGCVATATAEVLNYLRLPNKCRGYKYYDLTILKKRVRVAINFYDQHFDWDNMRPSYDYTTSRTEAEKKAVAELMYACGMACTMEYTPNASTALTDDMANGVNEFFEGVKATFYNSFKPDVAYAELDNGRPLYFSGAKEGGMIGHAFVLDGYDEKGYMHCHMGLTGSGNGFYAITDMNGYTTAQDLITYVADDTPRQTFTPVDEIQNTLVTCDWNHPATEIETDKWYILQSVGRSCHTLSQGKSKKLMSSFFLPIDEPIEYMAPHLVRFVPNTSSGGYYIQTGLGDWFGTLTSGGNNGTTANKTRRYTTGKVAKTDNYFWFKDVTANLIMDCNTGGSSVAGWGSAAPTDTTSNASWQLFPVSFKENPTPTAIENVTKVKQTETNYRLNPFIEIRNGRKILNLEK